LRREGNRYQNNIRRGLEFILSNVEASQTDGLEITNRNGTQIQRKLGPYIDTFLTSMLLSEVDGTLDAQMNARVRRALQIFLAEDSFSAQQAHDWGLVAKVVPAAELKAATRQFAERLAQNPPAAIRGTKSLVYQAATTPTKQQLDAEEKNIIDAMNTDDFRAAVKKFTSKSK